MEPFRNSRVFPDANLQIFFPQNIVYFTSKPVIFSSNFAHIICSVSFSAKQDVMGRKP
jgi:hypothetical protein